MSEGGLLPVRSYQLCSQQQTELFTKRQAEVHFGSLKACGTGNQVSFLEFPRDKKNVKSRNFIFELAKKLSVA